jgi:hypothetical protein
MLNNNFYIVSGDVHKIHEYLTKLGFEELIGTTNETCRYVIIGTYKKLFWNIKDHMIVETKRLIVNQCREVYIQCSFKEFRKIYESEKAI